MSNSPSAAEVIESCLIETTRVGRCNQIAESIIKHLEAFGYAIIPVKPTGDWEDVEEDDPDVITAARAIAEHGIGRPWDDFLPVNAYDVDHGDLVEYGRAAVAALRAAKSATA